MNGKQAKKIRREARSKTIGWFERNYEHEAKKSVRGGRIGMNSQVRLIPRCTRSVIKKMKREYLVGIR